MNTLKKKIWYLETIFKLGPGDVLYVFYYRLSLKLGWRKKIFPPSFIQYNGDFFCFHKKREKFPQALTEAVIKEADLLLAGNMSYYSYHLKQVGNPPNWFLNPFNQQQFTAVKDHWTELSDFDNTIGDIKNIWEASRFGWTTLLARAYSITGKEIYLATLNNWIKDWANKNPLNIGPNWKCGQETSIRIFNLLNTALVLQQEKLPAKELVMLIKAHLQRVEPNIRYAIAQRNNHATSEIAALFIANSWLASIEVNNKIYKVKSKKYQVLLEDTVAQLIYPDGSFAQHSITYHRVLVDTLSFVQFWSLRLTTLPFSNPFLQKATAAINWLQSITGEESGDCPNLGANDGALLLNLHSAGYRNFKPSLQLAKALYQQEMLDADEMLNEPLYWFEIDTRALSKASLQKQNHVFENGYCVMRDNDSWALCRFPFYKFRPSHNDVLHFDLWYKGKNILMDSGSYSYNPGKDYKGPDLKSVYAHNTVSFDHGEQMPRLSRFLLAKWIQPTQVSLITTTSEGKQEWSASYKDYRGNYHQRKINWGGNIWNITDTFKSSAATVETVFNIGNEKGIINEKEGVLSTSWGSIRFPNTSGATIRESAISTHYWQQEKIRQLVITTTNNNCEIKIQIKLHP